MITLLPFEVAGYVVVPAMCSVLLGCFDGSYRRKKLSRCFAVSTSVGSLFCWLVGSTILLGSAPTSTLIVLAGLIPYFVVSVFLVAILGATPSLIVYLLANHFSFAAGKDGVTEEQTHIEEQALNPYEPPKQT